MSKLPDDRSEVAFEDFKSEYSARQAVLEANRCLYCSDAPCINACPTSINIPEFIRKIATGNVRGSANSIFASNILGMSCARVCPVEVLCVGDCVFNEMGVPPIQIGKLQRYSTDVAYEKGWGFFEAGKSTGKSVAMIGGGPASLACAHQLRRYGHSVTIYEKRDVLGGLNTTGVAPYKMKADKSIDEVEWILNIGGIEVKTGVMVGADVEWEQIEKDHDAVFLGLGLGPDRFIDLPGRDLEGIHGAVDYIEQLKLGKVDLDGVRAVTIIGGGNTAVDVVRELKGLGVKYSVLVYRGTEDQMPGYEHEWAAAKKEGCTALWQRMPIEYLGEGRVQGIRVIKYDAEKKPIEGTEHDVATDLVLLAIGQAKLGALVEDLEGIETEWGKIKVDANGATGRPGFYAGGDCVNGGKEVVNGAAEGKTAAIAIHTYLTGAK